MLETHTLKQEIISVDSFDAEEYKTKDDKNNDLLINTNGYVFEFITKKSLMQILK